MKDDLTPAGKVVPIKAKPVNANDIFQEMVEWTNRIAKRAYELFQFRGSTDGHDMDDWLTAEQELLKPIALEVKDNDQELIVRVELPGFEANDVEVEVDANNLVIQGKQESTKEEKEKDDKTIYTEWKAQQIYRRVALPAAVVVDKVHAKLKNGILEVKLPKAANPKSVKVTAA